MTRVHASDGSLMAEYSIERRLFLPIQTIPDRVKNAFIAAEDKNFYTHSGVDPSGVLRALITNYRNQGSGKRPIGASTITQQVAKNFFLTNEVSIDRKIKEMLLSLRIEQAYSKDKILELYLNEIYLGFGAYGVAAAALDYFGKSVQELTDRAVRLSRRAAEGAEQLQPVPLQGARARPSQLGHRPHGRGQDDLEGRRREGQGRAARDHRARRRAPHVRRRLFRRRGAPQDRRPLWREAPLRRRPLGARDARSEDAGRGPQGAQCRPVALRLCPRLVDGPRHPRRPDAGRGLGRQDRRHPSYYDLPEWHLAVVLSVNATEAEIGLQPARNDGGRLSTARDRGRLLYKDVPGSA